MGRCARRAAAKSGGGSVLVLVDGPRAIREFELPQLTIVDGDAKSLSIACASIIAKVVRDRWMERLDRRHPGYGFARHKGYGTKAHLAALDLLGVSSAHRLSYAPVTRRALEASR
jgi:ribonuclease HII